MVGFVAEVEAAPRLRTCVGASCPVLPPWIKSYRRCPWRSGKEKRALCRLATSGGTYTYTELAEVFGTRCATPDEDGRFTAQQVGALFGIGKGRVRAVERDVLKRLKLTLERAVSSDPSLSAMLKELKVLFADSRVE